MARTALAVQELPLNSGALLTEATPDAANGNNFPNDGHIELVVHNGDASSKTITVRSVACSHGRTGDVVVVVTAGNRAVLGPFATDIFNQVDGSVNVDWSASTSVKVCALRQR